MKIIWIDSVMLYNISDLNKPLNLDVNIFRLSAQMG